MSDVAPALTPDEWAAGEIDRRSSAGDCYARSHDSQLEAGVAYWGMDALEASNAFLESPDRHALAALALHGQPFGFTWNDVEFLVGVQTDMVIGSPDHTQMEGLAARLAALLPPRETP